MIGAAPALTNRNGGPARGPMADTGWLTMILAGLAMAHFDLILEQSFE
jgi:hypothetical protein